MDTLPVSMETLAAVFNISSEEYSTFFEENEGVKTPISQEKIGLKLKDKFGSRVEDLVGKRMTKETKDIEGKYKRLAYKEIEDEIKEVFGISTRFGEDKLSKVKELVESKQPKQIKVEKTKEFLDMVKDYEVKLSNKDKEYSEKISDLTKSNTKESLFSILEKYYLSDEVKGKLNIPSSENVRRKQIGHIINELYSNETFKPSVREGKGVLLDEDGELATDKLNGYQPYDFRKVVFDIAKDGYFSELKTPTITSPNPLGDPNSTTINVEVNGAQQTFSVPKFNSIEELMDFTAKAEANGKPIELINEANKQLDNF